MILVDTSVWADHLRAEDAGLRQLLDAGEVCIHPLVIGEIALGFLRRRHDVLGMLADLPQVPVANDGEVLAFIEAHRLYGRGIGLVDVHLLAAAALADATPLWARDRRLAEAAAALGLAHTERPH